MSNSTYADIFKTAMGQMPYNYQCRIACGSKANLEDQRTLLDQLNFPSVILSTNSDAGYTACIALET